MCFPSKEANKQTKIPNLSVFQVVYFGLHIVTPLISLDLLKYPKLCHDVRITIHHQRKSPCFIFGEADILYILVQYFALLSHLLEVYPETVAQLNSEAFAHVLGTLDFGLHHQVNRSSFDMHTRKHIKESDVNWSIILSIALHISKLMCHKM